MHSYRKSGDTWQVGYHCPASGTWDWLGPIFNLESDAAAFASFLNGGRFSPGEIEHVFAVPLDDDEDDDSIHPDRPKELEDYPLDRRK